VEEIMQKENEILDIRLKLEGETRERFLKIKESKGLTNNTEVLRLLITEYPFLNPEKVVLHA